MRCILFAILMLVPVGELAGQDNRCWNIFRGDQALTGQTDIRLPEDPELLWTCQTGDEIRSSPVACEGYIVTGSGDGIVYCLDASGRLNWKFETGNMIEAPALILGGKAFIGNMDGNLYAIELDTGKESWKYQTGNQISGSPNWWHTGDQTSILVGSYDFFLYCLEAQTGRLRWKYESDNFINGAAACAGGLAVFGGCDGFLHMVDIDRGVLRDKILVASYVASSVLLSGDFAYIGDYDGKFSCISLPERKVLWEWTDEQTKLPFIASAAQYRNSIITGNRDKYVYCFNKSNGDLLWKYNTGARVDASPVVSGDRLLIANTRGDLIILDAREGSEIWTYELGSPVTGNPALLPGRIIVGASDGYVYCFGNR